MRQFAVLSSSIALLSLVLPSLHCSPANAQVKAADAPPAVTSWTGFYIGANAGYGWGKSGVSLLARDPGSAFFDSNWSPQAPSFDTSGALGGVQLGYNWQLGPSWLIGVETDFNLSDIKGSGSANSLARSITTSAEERIKWFGTIRGRLGYLPIDPLLVYATGGLAYGRIEQSVSLSNTGPLNSGVVAGFYDIACPGFTTCMSGSETRTAVGWTLGGGLEFRFWRNATVKAEYLFVNLGENDFVMTALATQFPAGTTPGSYKVHFDSTRFHTGRIGVNFNF